MKNNSTLLWRTGLVTLLSLSLGACNFSSSSVTAKNSPESNPYTNLSADEIQSYMDELVTFDSYTLPDDGRQHMVVLVKDPDKLQQIIDGNSLELQVLIGGNITIDQLQAMSLASTDDAPRFVSLPYDSTQLVKAYDGYRLDLLSSITDDMRQVNVAIKIIQDGRASFKEVISDFTNLNAPPPTPST